jgi:hypothetical protein
MKLLNSILFALLLSFSFTGCVYYSHSAYTNIRQDSFDKNYEYLKTESLWVGFNYAEKQSITNQSSQNINSSSDKPMTDEEKQALLDNLSAGNQNLQKFQGDPNLIITEPTFIQLTNFVKRKYGENAVIGNVVWDVKNTLFFWNTQKIESVTFDVYSKIDRH